MPECAAWISQEPPLLPPHERLVRDGVVTTLFRGGRMLIGLFRAHPDYPRFEDSGPTRNHLIAFPRTTVVITHSGSRPVLADPNLVLFYNRGQAYRRESASERGDISEWFAFDPELIAEIVRPWDPDVDCRPDRPFALTHGPVGAGTYLRQRLLIEHLSSATPVDPLRVEQEALEILHSTLTEAFKAAGLDRKGLKRETRRAHAELAERARFYLTSRLQESPSLTEVAEATNSSVYHLCRVFRSVTGMSLHAYLNQIRLRTSLEMVAASRGDLIAVSHELGFSSHSHFTQAFKRTFRLTPSQYRRIACGKVEVNPGRILIART